MIEIYCDASYTKRFDYNAGVMRSATCGLAYCPEYNLEEYSIDVDYTNIRGELAAAYCAIKIAIHIKNTTNRNDFAIISDSMVLIEGMNNWIYKWSHYQDPVTGKFTSANEDLYKLLAIEIMTNDLHIKWMWVKGHMDKVRNGSPDYNKNYNKFYDYNNVSDPNFFNRAVKYNCYADKTSRSCLVGDVNALDSKIKDYPYIINGNYTIPAGFYVPVELKGLL